MDSLLKVAGFSLHEFGGNWRGISTQHADSVLTEGLSGRSSVANRKAGWDGEDTGIGIVSGDDLQMNSYGTVTRVGAGDDEVGLEIGGVPEFTGEGEGLVVADGFRGDGSGFARAGGEQAVDGLFAEAVAREEPLAVIKRAGWREGIGEPRIEVRDHTEVGCEGAVGVGMGLGVEDVELIEAFCGIDSLRLKVVAFAVDAALAVTEDFGGFVGGDGAAVVHGPSADEGVGGGEGQARVGEDFNARNVRVDASGPRGGAGAV
jgi:hypothetical protein